MNDDRDFELVDDIVRRQCRSLLQYIAESYPWSAPDEQKTWDQVRRIVEEQRADAMALGRFLARHRRPPPYIGAFPSSFTDVNFVSLDYWLSLLVKQEREEVARLERDLAVLKNAEARQQVQHLLEHTRQHLKTLEMLAKATSKAA